MSGYPYGPVDGWVTMQPPRVCVGLGWRVPQPCRQQAAELWGGCLTPQPCRDGVRSQLPSGDTLPGLGCRRSCAVTMGHISYLHRSLVGIVLPAIPS